MLTIVHINKSVKLIKLHTSLKTFLRNPRIPLECNPG
nr:MAG TPA: hypothetical protein [Caudoviricetes sp.]